MMAAAVQICMNIAHAVLAFICTLQHIKTTYLVCDAQPFTSNV